MTKVIHVVEDPLSVIASGITTGVSQTHSQLVNAGINSKVLSVTSALPKNEWEHPAYFKNGFWRYSKTFAAQIENELKSDEPIIHTHGVFMYPQYIANTLARKHSCPYVVSPRGMLEPPLFKKNWLKYKLYLSLFQQKNLKNASVLHAVTPIERDNLFAITGSKNIHVIENLIPISLLDGLNLPDKKNEQKYILYVGRLHPNKGIELLLNAFARLTEKNVFLKIAGPKNDYSLVLEALAEKLGISQRVEFLGLVKGDKKFKLYRDAFIFVAPSYSEAIGRVNLEAGLMATPVITTFQTGILNGWNENGGILINPDLEELYQALSRAISWSVAERDDRGNKLKNYVIDNYSWEKNLYKWVDLYSSLHKTSSLS